MGGSVVTSRSVEEDTVTEATRRVVWNDLLDVARVTRYAEAMGSRYRLLHHSIRFGLLLAASGSMATFLDVLPNQWRVVFDLAIAVLIVADFMLDGATKIAVLTSTKRECDVLGTEWRELWLDVDLPGGCPADSRKSAATVHSRYPTFSISARAPSSSSR